MVSAISKFIQLFAAVLPTLLDWWKRRQTAQTQIELETRVADIRRDPANSWVSGFNGTNKSGNGSANADKAGTDQPGSTA